MVKKATLKRTPEGYESECTHCVKADLIIPILAGLLFPTFRYKVYSIFH
jgi:hypothetical protein